MKRVPRGKAVGKILTGIAAGAFWSALFGLWAFDMATTFVPLP
jgi:hypothetical protein